MRTYSKRLQLAALFNRIALVKSKVRSSFIVPNQIARLVIVAQPIDPVDATAQLQCATAPERNNNGLVRIELGRGSMLTMRQTAQRGLHDPRPGVALPSVVMFLLQKDFAEVEQIIVLPAKGFGVMTRYANERVSDLGFQQLVQAMAMHLGIGRFTARLQLAQELFEQIVQQRAHVHGCQPAIGIDLPFIGRHDAERSRKKEFARTTAQRF